MPPSTPESVAPAVGEASTDLRILELRLPIKPRTKERPRFGPSRIPFNTPAYREWKDAVRELVEHLYHPKPLTGRLRVSFEWHTPTDPAGDVDGLIGGFMDALQPDQQGPKKDAPWSYWEGRVAYVNDGLIRELGHVRWIPSADRVVVIRLEEIARPAPPPKPSRARKAGKP